MDATGQVEPRDPNPARVPERISEHYTLLFLFAVSGGTVALGWWHGWTG